MRTEDAVPNPPVRAHRAPTPCATDRGWRSCSTASGRDAEILPYYLALLEFIDAERGATDDYAAR